MSEYNLTNRKQKDDFVSNNDRILKTQAQTGRKMDLNMLTGGKLSSRKI